MKAIFFDRDGVVNHLVKRNDGSLTSPWSLDEFKYISGIKTFANLVKILGYKRYVVTNQPGVSDNDMTLFDLLEISYKVKNDLCLDRILCSTDRKSNWYKPKNGMIEDIIKMDDIDRSHSFLIGDRWKDIMAGNRMDLVTIFLGTYDKCLYTMPHYAVDNVLDACKLIGDKYG